MAKKIAEQLIDTLVESGVERIYAVTGDSLNEVNEAVRKNNKIQWIHVRHEETGAYAAAAEAQLTGRIGCWGMFTSSMGYMMHNAQAHRSSPSLPPSPAENSGLNIFRRPIL